MIIEPPITSKVLESTIRSAFCGVRLDGGVSLKQAQAIDHYGEGVTDAEFDALPLTEEAEDWTQVTLDELERDCIAHLDAKGFRYYIAPLMLALLSHYDSESMRVIGTISALYPKQDAWPYHMERYSLLSESQKQAIAMFLRALPQLVNLDYEDRQVVPRALRNYWGQFQST